MPFLARNKVKGYKDLELGEVTNPNPLTIKYPYEKKTVHYLVKFIWLVHERKNLVPNLHPAIYTKHIKKLLEEMDADQIIDLILKAGEVCNHPFTVKFLRKLFDDTRNKTFEDS